MKGRTLGARHLKKSLFFFRLARKKSSLASMKRAALLRGSEFALKCLSIRAVISCSLLRLLVMQ